MAFIGVGETPADLEKFRGRPVHFRLLGMGDIKTLIERAQEVRPTAVDVESLMRGNFTLKDMYQQMEAMNKLGPLKQIMQMLPRRPWGGAIRQRVSDDQGPPGQI